MPHLSPDSTEGTAETISLLSVPAISRCSGLSFSMKGPTGFPRSARTSLAIALLQRRLDVRAQRRVLGLHGALVELDDLAVLPHQVLAEVPARRLFRLLHKVGVDRVGVLALDGDLLEHRERHVVLA